MVSTEILDSAKLTKVIGALLVVIRLELKPRL